MSNSSLIPRPNVLEAILAGRIVSVIGIIFTILILIPEIASLYYTRKKFSLRHAHTRANFSLFLVTLFGLWTLLICLLVWWVNWLGNPEGCHDLVAPMIALIYVIMKQCLYLFLYDRAKVVHESLNLQAFSLRVLRTLVFLASTAGVPLVVYWMFFTYWQSKVLPEGICVQYVSNVGGIIAVASLDFCLSLLMLSLFIAPLLRYSSSDQVMNKDIGKLVRKNLTISTMMMFSTMSSLIFMSVILNVVFGKNPPNDIEYLQIWSTFAPMIDTIMTILLSHTISTIWIPKSIKEKLFFKSESGNTNNQAGVANYSNKITAVNSIDEPTKSRDSQRI